LSCPRGQAGTVSPARIGVAADSNSPLPLAELVALIDNCNEDGAAVFAPLRLSARGGTERIRGLAGFVTVGSEFYPLLGRYYAARIAHWIDSRVAETTSHTTG
jgi:hypothetical protein